jgi:glycosyltransferase involved in cell wall biosynthesis
MQRLRVAALMDTAVVSGPGRQLVAVAGELKQHHVETRLIMFHRRGLPPPVLPDYAQEHGIDCDVVQESGRLDVRVVGRVSRFVRAFEAHILQSHSYKPAAIAFFLRRRLEIPWIGMFHGTTLEDRRVRLYNWIDRRLLQRADRIVVVSPTQRALFPERADRLTVIPNAVLPGRAPTSRGLGPIGDEVPRPRIAVIGRLSHEKGVDVFLDAFVLLRQRGFTGSGLLVGDGPERRALQERAVELGISDRIAFLGHRTDVDALYPLIDLVVIPSRSEGMPNVLLEAIRADVPVVSTAVGAVPTVVGSRDGVLLVPPGQPDPLADAIDRGLRVLHSTEARIGREAIALEFSLDRRARLLRSLYESVLASTNTSRLIVPTVSLDV